ncbi:ATP-binding protein [Candidatus Accumulibacter sp. ACC003]|uniref:sensor histidine kinase n=1 Tax=Candidatus Accumulibacter sp. ACC003 TaxID=2823334 RepID=UPI0025BD46EC|nr:ATP-binding protein [Candidatus Accumulibacter sp. ACC003]
MKIRLKERLATGSTLVVIGLLALAIGWAYLEVGDANRQRQQASEISLGLTQVRLVTFEYRQYRLERARVQWFTATDHLDRLIASSTYSGSAQREIIGRLRASRVLVRNIFTALSAVPVAEAGAAVSDESRRRFELQLDSRLLVVQQDSLNDAFRLTELATERINRAQERVLVVIGIGLTSIALVTLGTSWLIRRSILGPVVSLQQATEEIAAGNWEHRLGLAGDDEIGALAGNFDAMVRKLRDAHAELARRNRALIASNEELEAFSYSVSHDLRAPLRSMDGFSLMLLEDYSEQLDEEGKDALQRIRGASQRMGAIIDDLLRLSHVTRVELAVKPLDLSAMARDIADEIDREHSDRALAWVIEAGLRLSADPALMRIALDNLLRNACKFSAHSERPLIRVGALPGDARNTYFVADNGVGFDMAYSDKLFGAFQRLHHASDFPGSGIGLAIVQRIIRRHHGRVWAESTQGRGATFFFDLKEANNGPDEQDHPAG